MYKKILILSSILLINNSKVFANEEIKNDTRINEIVRSIDFLNKNNKLFELAINYKKIGNFDKALEILNSLNKSDEINFYIADILKMQGNIDESINIFEKINKNDEIIIKLAELYSLMEDKESFSKLINSTNGILNNILKGIYYYSPIEPDNIRAQNEFEKAYDLDKKNKYILYYLAQIYLDNNDRKKAEDFCIKSITEDYFYSTPHALLGYIQFLNRDFDKSFFELNLAKFINPYEIKALMSLGNGMTKYTYSYLEKDNNLKLNNEIINSNNIAFLIKKYPNNIHSYIKAGALELDNSNYDKSIYFFKKALSINNYYGLANNGLAIAIKEKIRNQSLEKNVLNLDLYDYSSMNENDLKKIFINFSFLSDLEKKIIKYSIFNLKGFLEKLAYKKATHYILPIYEKSTDYKFGQDLKEKRTFDNRLWDDVRGRGGLNSLTGIEDLLEAYHKGFNTLIHEFAHQIHQYALSEKDKSKILDLYINARKENKFMDYYSSSDEYEYFAQGIESYLSTQGKNTLKDTAKNTREILLNTDKDLYFFIEKLLDKS